MSTKYKLLPRKHWMSDDQCPLCCECHRAFSLLLRRHHCRMCGQIFCHKCSNYWLAGQIFKVEGKVRVCKRCFKEFTTPKTTPKEIEDVVEENRHSWSYFKDSSESNYKSSKDIFTKDIENDGVNSDAESESSVLVTTPEDSPLPVPRPLKNIKFRIERSTTPEIVSRAKELEEQQESDEQYLFNLPRTTSRTSAVASFMSLFERKKGPLPKIIRRQSSNTSLKLLNDMHQTVSWEEMSYEEQLKFRSEQHCIKLLKYLVSENNLPIEWISVINDLASSVTSQLESSKGANPKTHSSIYHIPGGRPQDSLFINGIVLNNRVVHKDMRTKFRNPRILLFECPLDFERIQGKLNHLKTVTDQEEGYIKMVVDKIIQLQPNIVMTNKHISRLTLNLLLDAKISVVTNVSLIILRQISMLTGSYILESLKELLVLPANPSLLSTDTQFQLLKPKSIPKDDGTIDHFLILEKSKSKYSTILLRGNRMQLKKVEKILMLLIYANYNGIREISYLAEEGCNSRFLENYIRSLPDKYCDEFFDLKLLNVGGIERTCINEFQKWEQEYQKGKSLNTTLQLLSYSPNIYYPQLKKIISLDNENNNDSILKVWPTLIISEKVLIPNFIDNEYTTSLLIRKRNRSSYDFPSMFTFPKKSNPNPLNQQEFLYLHTLCCSETGKHCIPYAIHRIQFYNSDTDLPLGRFLKDYCFSQGICKVDNCLKPMILHDRSFCHYKGRINITTENASEFLEKLDSNTDIICWSSCPKCEITTPFVTMTSESLDYSFGKWLEHSFYYQGPVQDSRCNHSPVREHIRYFMHKKIVAAVSYEKTPFYDVHIPPLKVLYLEESSDKIYKYEVNLINLTLQQVFQSILDQIDELETQLKREDDIHHLKELRCSLEEEKEQIFKRFKSIQEIGKDDFSELNRFKRNLFVTTVTWNSTLLELHYKRLSTLVTRREVLTSAQAHKGILSNDDSIFVMYGVKPKAGAKLLSASSSIENQNIMPKLNEPKSNLYVTDIQNNKKEQEKLQGRSRYNTMTTSENTLSMPKLQDPATRIMRRSGNYEQSLLSSVITPIKNTKNIKSRSTSFLLPSEFENRNLKASDSAPGDILHLPVSDVTFCTNRHITNFNIVFGDNEITNNWDFDNSENEFEIETPILSKSPPRSSNSRSSKASVMGGLVDILPNIGTNSLVSLSPGALRDASGLFFSDGIDNSIIVVNEKEPSSLIAHAMMTEEYHQFINTKKEEILKQKKSSELDEKQIYLLSENSTNIEVSIISTQQESKMKCTVTVYHAVQFQALRNLCIPENTFIQSISHSENWDATGGKSGSSWEKTLDERYVIKRLPKVESEAFKTFAPKYFKYLAKAFACQVPTLLAKIFGVFTINYRNGQKVIKQDVIIMENLFYNRKISQIFDLKGSLRNRLIDETVEKSFVLLDENLLKDMFQYPLCVDEHSKALITLAVWNDTLFLSSLNVMDYSVIVGIDEETNQLVIGIVDYIRQYTLDKQIEKWVKSQQGTEQPTVIAPKDYKVRFRNAMWNYFVMVPNKFTNIINPKEEEPTNTWENAIKQYNETKSHASRRIYQK